MSRVLTHWSEIVGESISVISRPVEVSYNHQGMGATLTVLTTGPNAPILEMQKQQIRDKVNACYGYNAIHRVRITQTAPIGFSEGQVAFDHTKKTKPKLPNPAILNQAREIGAGADDDTLRKALETLATNFLSRHKN